MNYHQRQTQRAIQQTIRRVVKGLGWVLAFHAVLIGACLLGGIQ